MSANETLPEQNNAALSGPPHENFRGRVLVQEWKNHIFACLYHRRFHYAAKILAQTLSGLGVSQDVWLWRAAVIVVANIETTDEMLHSLYRVVYFGKSQDYEERRLCLFFIMLKLGRTEMAFEYLEKDMPKKMRSGFKVSSARMIRKYEERIHALLQMWRGIASFWKKDRNSDDDNKYDFDLNRCRTQKGLSKNRARSVSPTHIEESSFDDSEKDSDDETMPEDPKPMQEVPLPQESATFSFMAASGYEIMQNFTVHRILQMFECFFEHHECLDSFVKYYIEIAELGGGNDDRVEQTLQRYAELNSSHPTALKFLLDFYLRRKPEDKLLRQPVLQDLCTLVPYGNHVTQLVEDLSSENDIDVKTIGNLVIPALDYRCHWNDITCWTSLATIIQKPGNDLPYMKESYAELHSYWNKMHFRFPERDQEESKLLLAKIQVCWALFGSEHSYVVNGMKLMSSKYRKKLAKKESALQLAKQILNNEIQGESMEVSDQDDADMEM